MKPSKLFGLLITAALGYGGYWVYQNYNINVAQDIQLTPKSGQGQTIKLPNVFGGTNNNSQPAPSNTPRLQPNGFNPSGLQGVGGTLASAPKTNPGGTIHISSFNIQVLGEAKMSKPAVVNVLADVIRRFDIVAIQEIRSTRDDIIPTLLQHVNSGGRAYDYCIGPRVGRTVSKEQYAFLFNTQTIEIDRQSVYTINDPSNRLHRPPLVASFRVRGPPPQQAFTFTLINIHTDPDLTVTELDAMGDAFKVVRDYNPNEDDVLVLGDLNVDDRHLGKLGQIPGITWAISGQATNTRQTKQYDNIVFHRQNTVEFSGRSGVLNLCKEYNLTLDQALEVSDHFPIWAEFGVYEGQQPSGLATRPGDAPR